MKAILFFLTLVFSLSLAHGQSSSRPDGALERELKSPPHNRYLLLVPEHYDPQQKYELWVSVHGVVGTPEDSLSFLYAYARQRGVFLVGATGSAKPGAGTTWDWNEDHHAIAAMVRQVQSEYAIDPQKVMLVGFSRGAYMSWRTLGAYPHLFRLVAVVGRGIPAGEAPSRPETWPLADEAGLREAAKSTPVFWAAGKQDPAYRDYDRTVRVIKALGFQYRAMTREGVRHAITSFVHDIIRWHDEQLGLTTDDCRAGAIPIDGVWKAAFTNPMPAKKDGRQVDPGITEAARVAVAADFDDSGWAGYRPPSAIQSLDPGYRKTNGEVVLRKTFEVPESLAGRDLCVVLGPIDDTDETYLNGQLIGQTKNDTPYYWIQPRCYRIPAGLVKAGRDVLAIRLFDELGDGNVCGIGDGIVYLRPAGDGCAAGKPLTCGRECE